MPEPTVHKLRLNGIEITSIVMDEPDFMDFADELAGVFIANDDRAGERRAAQDSIDRIKKAKHLPMMKRGTKTQVFFKRWNIQTDLLSAIVRGHGETLLQELLQA